MTYNIFSSILSGELTIENFLICSAVSLILGFMLSLANLYKNRTTKSFSVTVAVLPMIVQMVIMLVNGNLGTGIAVAGTFSLVRFRSVPGSAKEILSIFMAMAVGLGTGTGYIGFSAVFTLIIIICSMTYTYFDFGDTGKNFREVKITVPESVNYTEAFAGIFEKYAKDYRIKRVKTSNMGSLYQLFYTVNLKSTAEERKFIDELRTRNGNLEISLNYSPTVNEEL